jgi:hypothetical protein
MDLQMKNTIGDAPIDLEYVNKMKAIAKAIDELFNGNLKGENKKVGFCLMVFPFKDFDGRANYISNAERADIIVLLKEQLARFQGQPEIKGRA